MVVVPLSKPENEAPVQAGVAECEAMNWLGFAAGGTLVAGGLLMIIGERRAGLVAAASGTALAMLDQPETLRTWWEALPGYIDQVQHLIGRVQDTVNEVAVKREELRVILAK